MPERLIDADAFLKDVLPECKYPDALREAVERQPTIEAEPVRHGRWKYDDVNDIDYCGECNAGMNGEFPFCPWCGAKMDGGADNAE